MKTNCSSHNRLFGKLTLIAPLCLAALLLQSCSNQPKNELSGYLEGDFIYLSSHRAGYLESWDATNGDSILANQCLFRLESTQEIAQVKDMASRIAAAESRLADARKGERPQQLAILDSQIAESEAASAWALLEKERTDRLHQTGAVTQSECDFATTQATRSAEVLHALKLKREAATLGMREDAIQALEHEIESLKSQHELALWHLEKCEGRAPADVLLHRRLFEAGEWVPAGKPVALLRPIDHILVIFYVPSDRVGKLTSGEAIQVTAPGLNQPLMAHVRTISTRAEYAPPILYSQKRSGHLTFRVEAAVTGTMAASLNPGQPVQIHLSK